MCIQPIGWIPTQSGLALRSCNDSETQPTESTFQRRTRPSELGNRDGKSGQTDDSDVPVISIVWLVMIGDFQSRGSFPCVARRPESSIICNRPSRCKPKT